jgi:hypothetical protein
MTFKRLRGLFKGRVEVFEHRLHGTHDEGQAGERHGDHDAERRIGDANAPFHKDGPEPAIGREKRGERDARHGRRQCERQVHDGVDEAPAGEVVAHQRQGGQHGDPIAGHRARRRDDLPVVRGAEAGRLEDQRSDRKRDDQTDVEERDAQREPQSGDDGFSGHCAHVSGQM